MSFTQRIAEAFFRFWVSLVDSVQNMKNDDCFLILALHVN